MGFHQVMIRKMAARQENRINSLQWHTYKRGDWLPLRDKHTTLIPQILFS